MPPDSPMASWCCCKQQGPLAPPTHLASLYAPLTFFIASYPTVYVCVHVCEYVCAYLPALLLIVKI